VHTLVATGFVERDVIPKIEAQLFVASIPGDVYVGENDHASTSLKGRNKT
jgi:hypothetical protein